MAQIDVCEWPPFSMAPQSIHTHVRLRTCMVCWAVGVCWFIRRGKIQKREKTLRLGVKNWLSSFRTFSPPNWHPVHLNLYNWQMMSSLGLQEKLAGWVHCRERNLILVPRIIMDVSKGKFTKATENLKGVYCTANKTRNRRELWPSGSTNLLYFNCE